MKLRLLYQAKAHLFLLIGCMLGLIVPQSSFADNIPLDERSVNAIAMCGAISSVDEGKGLSGTTVRIKVSTDGVLSVGNGKNTVNEGVDYFLPKIDLGNWKLNLPIGNPTELRPPAILDNAKNETLQNFMFKTKILKNPDATDTEILHADAEGEDEGYTFDEYVETDPFTLEVSASDGRLEVILNENCSAVYADIHMQKWGIFENYFKAGNYLLTRDEGAFARVKYYNLVVSH
ncbi:MAG: polysaccharide lyase family 7 protein [Bacteroidia bacterium]|nr:polysaccharide lyase family 7 protein [Bacteroidia bacterium]